MLERLLSRGYFPRELPPPFSTSQFGSAVAHNWAAAPASFSSGQRPTASARHSLVRSGYLRRELGIPNPISHAAVCHEIAQQWPQIEAVIQAGRLSTSRPIFHATGARAFFPKIAQQGRLVRYRAEARARGRMIVRTDVARFYHSIYTHSVPWALHGKAAAKANKSMTLAGNRLDRALRNSRDGQTVGIRIGPDSSLCIAELILSKIDVDLQARAAMRGGFRYIDDYELSAETEAQAADLIAAIQELLAHYELEINPVKTSIMPVPLSLEAAWASELRALPLATGTRSERHDVIRLFDRAFDYVRETPTEPILRYVMGRLRTCDVAPANWKLYQELLLQSITVEPGCLPTAAANLLRHANNGFPVDAGLWQDALNRLIVFHAPLRHDNEVAWALWLILSLRFRVETRTIATLASNDDSVVALLTLHAEDTGLLDAQIDKTLWTSLMCQESLSDKNWLLAYEASERHWLPTVAGTDIVGADVDFGFLRSLGVRFYDPGGVGPLQPTGVSPSFGLAPIFAFY